MIAALVVAIPLGVLATYALVGRGRPGTGFAATMVAGLPLVGVSVAGIESVTLVWAVAASVVVAVGMIIGPRLRTRSDSPFSAAVSMAVGLVLAGAVVAWLVPVAASLANLDPWVLAICVIAAAACWVAGDRGTLMRTTAVLIMGGGVLLLIAGVVAGAPATLTAPLIPAPVATVPAVLWLIVVLLLAILHPGQDRSIGGAVAIGAVLLVGLLGLMSVLAGALLFPSSGLIALLGYITSGNALIGAVLAVGVVVVAAVGAGAAMRTVLEPGVPAPHPALEHRGLQVVLVAVGVGFVTFMPVGLPFLVIGVVIIGVVDLVLSRLPRRSRPVTPGQDSAAETVRR